MQNENTQAEGAGTIGVGSKLYLEGNLDLTEQLGAGATAVVYKGHYHNRVVAVKVMHPEVSDTTRSFFLSEGTNLSQLRQNWPQCWPKDPLAVPEFIAEQPRGEQPYLVMEFLQGTPVEELLKEGRKFNELETLELGIQLGKILVVLHEKMNQCYADIKFGNLWLLDKTDPKARIQLKVSDWNVLSEKTEDRVQRDLFYASQFLFRILTRVSLPLRGMQLEGRVENQEAFKRLSIAMQRFFQMALHPNPAFRFETAREWVNYLKDVAGWWKQEAYELYPTIGSLLEQAVKLREDRKLAEAAHILRQVRDMLDNLRREERGDRAADAQVVQMFEVKIKEGLESTSELKSGQILLDSRSFSEAAQIFLNGAELNAVEPEKILRYYWLAKAAQILGREWFDAFNSPESQNAADNRLVKGVEALVAGNIRAAHDVFNSAVEQLGARAPEELRALRDETVILLSGERASQYRQQGKYREAEIELNKAAQLYRRLPVYPKTNWSEALGDVYQLWQFALHEQQTLGESQRQRDLAKTALSRSGWREAAQHFVTAVEAAEQSDEAVAEWRQAVRDRMTAGDLDAALILAEGSLSIERARQKVLPLWQMGRHIQKIKDLLKQGQHEESQDQLRGYVRQYGDTSDGMNEAFYKVSWQVFQDIRHQNPEKAEMVIALLRGLKPEWASEMENELERDQQLRRTRLNEDINVTIQRIKELYDKNTLDDLNKAVDLIRELRARVDPNDPRRRDQENLFENISKRQKRLEEQQRGALRANQEKIQKIASEISQLKQQIQQLEKLGVEMDKDEYNDVDLNEHIQRVKAKKTAELIVQAIRLRKLDSHKLDHETQSLLESIQDREEDKEKVLQWIEMREWIDQLLNPLLDRFDQALKQGDFQLCQDLMREYPKLVEFRPQLKTDWDNVRAFAQWVGAVEKHQARQPLTPPENDLVLRYGLYAKGLKAWSEKGLVPSIWKWSQSKLNELLTRRTAALSNKLSQMKPGEDDLFYRNVAAWIDAHQDIDFLRAAADEAPPLPAVSVKVFVANLAKSLRKPAKNAAAGIWSQAEKELNQRRLEGQISDDELREAFEPKRERLFFNLGRLKTWQKVALIGILSVIVFGALILIFLWTRPDIEPTPVRTESVVENEAATAVTQDNTNTLTPPSTLTPVPPTNTPEPTLTPSPLPEQASIFLFPVENAPVLPEGVTGLFLIDDSAAIFMPEQGYWKELKNTDERNNAYGGAMHYAEAQENGEAYVQWIMDTGLTEDGFYEVFASDTLSRSGQVEGSLRYQVYQDDQPVQAVRGSPRIRQYTNGNHTNLGLTDLTLRSLGIYSLKKDGLISVKLDLTGEVLHRNRHAGADAVIIARINRPAADNPFITFEPHLMEWMKNNRLFLIFDQPVVPENVAVTRNNPESGAWEGVDSIDLAALTPGTKASFEWKISHPLPAPGKYEVFAWVAGNLSVNGAYQYSVANLPNVKGTVNVTKEENQPGSPGTLVSLGVIEIPAYEGAENGDLPMILTITLTPTDGETTGILAADVIFIVAAD